MTYSTHTLGIFLLTSLTLASVFKQYLRYSYLDGNKCVNSSRSFKLTNVSMMICADSSRRHTCPSFMFKEDGGVCFGCSVLFPLVASNYTPPYITDLVAEQDTEHYYDKGFELMFRFANDSMKTDEGRIEMWYKGVWGTICDDYLNDVQDPNKTGVKVMCKSMGFFGGGEYLPWSTYPGDLNNPLPIWLHEVSCDGTEANIAECKHDGFEPVCEIGEDVKIKCFN